MSEPAVTTGSILTAQIGSAWGSVALTTLAMLGMNPYSLGAALLGCIVSQTLLPAEIIRPWTIFFTTVGSMIFASFAAPWIAPHLANYAPATMLPEHINATASAILGAFPKPLFVILEKMITSLAEKFNVA